MNSYSIHPEISPQYTVEPTHENHEPEIDLLDWESRIAQLVGFEQESPQQETTSFELDYSQPEELETEQSLSSNPFAKLALVGGATLAVVVIAGVFLSQIMNSTNQRPRSNLVSPTVPSPAISEAPEVNLAQEVEILKTKLALAEQVQTVRAAQENLRNRPAARVETPPVRESTPTTLATSPPPIVRVERIIQQPASPSVPIIEQPPSPSVSIPPIAMDSTPPPIVIPAVSPPDPLKEWTRLAKLGSYGQVNTTGQSRVNTALSVPEIKTHGTNLQPEPTPPQPEILVSQRQSQNPKSVKVGTSAKAVLATAIFGETTRARNNNSQEDDHLFVVQLKEPLKSIDGAIAVPANTELLGEVRSISEQGLLQLNVVKIISEEKGELIERTLPKNAIVLRAPQGKPLIANQYPNQAASIAGMDTGLFILGGIGKAAELFNRAETEVSIEGGSTVVTNTNNRRNIPAGILEGGLRSIVPQISQRNQQAISQMMQRSNIWFIPAGQEVEIYVNRTVKL
jgi:hypothetical protein